VRHEIAPKPRPPTGNTERIIRRVVPANQPEEISTDVLGTMTLPMGQHTRETALAALDREESTLALASEEATAQLQAVKPPLKRLYEVTQIVRARHVPDETEQVRPRGPKR
jgi:hypothetical protein